MKCRESSAEAPPEKENSSPEQGGDARGGDSRFPQAVPLDWADEIALIQVHFRLLRWTPAEIKQQIANWFNGKQLSQLLDSELEALLLFLQCRLQE